MQNKIVPGIWFHSKDGRLAEILEYYSLAFGENFKASGVIPLGQTPSGNAEMCEAVIYGGKYSFLSTGEEHAPLGDSVSFIINCRDQSEIDRLWNYFTKEGKESQCGWCSDKYGLRWQILPENFGSLMSRPNAGQVMMSQKKIIISKY